MKNVKCIICGVEVTPETGVVLGAFGTPIVIRGRPIAYHQGACADLAKQTLHTMGRGLLTLLEHGAPRALKALRTTVRALREGTAQ